MLVVCSDGGRWLKSSEPASWLLVAEGNRLSDGAWKPGKNVWSCARVSSTAVRCCGKYLMRHPLDFVMGLIAWNNGVAVGTSTIAGSSSEPL